MSEEEIAYLEDIDDRFFKVRNLLQKYDLKRLTKEELIVEIKKAVDYRSEY